MCLTRPDITEIVWPTDEEMTATVASANTAASIAKTTSRFSSNMCQRA
jgi:hypothetical protein